MTKRRNCTFVKHFVNIAVTVILLTAIFFVCVVPEAAVYAEGKSFRLITIYYESHTDIGIQYKYCNTGIYTENESTRTINTYITDPNPNFYVTNQLGQTYTALDPDIADAETYYDSGNFHDKAKLTFKKPGTARFRVDIPEDDTYEASVYYLELNILGTSAYFIKSTYNESTQTITGSSKVLSNGDTDNSGITFYLDDNEPKLYLSNSSATYTSSDESVLSIGADGSLTLNGKGTATVTATVTSGSYAENYYCTVTVSERPTASDDDTAASTSSGEMTASSANTTTQSTASGSSKKTTASKVPTLKKPTLKCTKRMKKANKLTWSKVDNSSGYILYIKYPGSKKYVKALTKKSTIKSVTHRGLTKNKVYRYKLRAYVKVNGKTYYSPYSKVVKVKVK